MSRTKAPSATVSNYFITDNRNIIIDADFGVLHNPKQLEKEIKIIPGVIENGLFINIAQRVYIGSLAGIKKIDRKNYKNR